MQLRPYQTSLVHAIDAAWASGARNVLAVAPTGSGKCLGKGTPVLMFDGTIKPVENVAPGDLLMGPDSKPRLVLSTCTGRENLYEVVPVKGDPYVVNESHILSLKMTGGSNHSCGIKDGSVVNLSVGEYLRRNATFRHCAKGWKTGIDFYGRLGDDALEPYMLGFWLGDGNSRGLSFTTGDTETLLEVAKFAAKHKLFVRYEFNSQNSVQAHVVEKLGGIGWTGRRGARPGKWLRDQKLIQDKHIPHQYKVADRKTRLEVLAGVLDADGHMSHAGFDLTLVNERLFDDVLFIARSLGFSCHKSRVRKTCGNNGVTGDYFRCTISGDVSEIPCRIARKQAPKRQQKKDVLLTGVSVRSIGEGDYYGFEITGDRLFLLGDFTVTHNTVLFSHILSREHGATVAIAHRQELVTQMSLALARNGVRHRVIGPESVARNCVALHMSEVGRGFYDPSARCAVAGVDTLVRRDPKADPWFAQVTKVVQDEAHHVLRGNKWGKADEMFPNACTLGVTATPVRADGKGLGAQADGIMDVMVEGPTMRELIDEGYLTDYRIFAPRVADLDLSQVPTSAGGDFSPPKLREAVHKSRIVGDVVGHYLKHASGKLGVTFAVDVEAAGELARAYVTAGVPAEVVTAETPDLLRASVLRRFRNREVLQLVNVDLFGEGFDLPAIEVVSMARPTQSYALYCQQFGRALRLLDGKEWALIIDHVGNVMRHGLPDKPREWSLDRRSSRSNGGPNDTIPLRICLGCTSAYEAYRKVCPYCGLQHVPAGRGSPELVDGDLSEMDPMVLAHMRGEVVAADAAPRYPVGATEMIARRLRNLHHERGQEQYALRTSMATWGGWQTHLGRDDSEAQRRFYFRYGIDVLSAWKLNAADARRLREMIDTDLSTNGVVAL
jgi:superfamily II DNA or RNA helicase